MPPRYQRERNGYLQGGTQARTYDDERKIIPIYEKEAKRKFYQQRSALIRPVEPYDALMEEIKSAEHHPVQAVILKPIRTAKGDKKRQE